MGKSHRPSSRDFTERVGVLQNQQFLSSTGCCETLPLTVCRQIPLPQHPLCLSSGQISWGFTSQGRQFSGRTGYLQCSLNVWEWKTPIRHDPAPSALCSLLPPQALDQENKSILENNWAWSSSSFSITPKKHLSLPQIGKICRAVGIDSVVQWKWQNKFRAGIWCILTSIKH